MKQWQGRKYHIYSFLGSEEKEERKKWFGGEGPGKMVETAAAFFNLSECHH